jgi:acetoin:2,6-dichlorophenolindophenol oxidoreductase subunit alpha
MSIPKFKFKPILEYGLEKKDLLRLYRGMKKIRDFENSIVEVYSKGEMPGLAHLYIGEEAIATGVCDNLNEEDYVTSTHRGHGHVIAQGLDLKRMMAEICGKEAGYCRGKGGTMHIADFNRGILGANGIVGAGIPIATGAGYAIKTNNTKQVSIAFFGDAACNQGTFHESVNMAAAWKLPVIYVCENNFFGISVDVRKVTNTKFLSTRAKAYDIPGITVNGNDVLEVKKVSGEAIERGRKGEGPTFIECLTYRHKGHHLGDPGKLYRNDSELKGWINICPIKTFQDRLIKEKVVTAQEIEEINQEVKELVEEAVQFAIDSPYPDEKEAYEDIFYEEKGV